MERTLALVRHDPAAALALILQALETLTERTTFLDAAISHVADEDLPTLADVALEACLGTPGHDLAQEVLAYVALQRPTVLHPHLDLLFELRPNVGTSYETYPWRESGDRHLAFLAPYLRGEPESLGDREAARERLLEARSPATLRVALFPEGGPVEATSWEQYGLRQVGFTLSGEGFVPLYADPVWHLTFAPGKLAPRYGRPEDGVHPTWSLPTTLGEHALGGELAAGTCGVCGGRTSC